MSDTIRYGEEEWNPPYPCYDCEYRVGEDGPYDPRTGARPGEIIYPMYDATNDGTEPGFSGPSEIRY